MTNRKAIERNCTSLMRTPTRGHFDISTTMGYLHHVPKTDDANALSALVEASLGALAQVA